MKPGEYRRHIEKLDLSQVRAGAAFGLSPRQSQRLAGGESSVPRPVAKLLNLVLKRKITMEDVSNADT